MSLSVGTVRHVAQDGWWSNWREAVRLSDTILLPKGQFLQPAAELGNTVYQTNYGTVSANTRHDHDQRFGITYGVPVSAIADLTGGEVPEQLGTVVLSARIEYYREFSSLINYAYSNTRAEAMMTKRWEF